MKEHERREPPVASDEKEMALGIWNLMRDTLVWKLDGLTFEQATTPHPPSTITLPGIVKHLTHVEQNYLHRRVLGSEPPARWNSADFDAFWAIGPDESIESIVAGYLETGKQFDEAIRAHDLDELVKDPELAALGVQIRRLVFDLIEEVSRHCGHADLIRESIDGATGE